MISIQNAHPQNELDAIAKEWYQLLYQYLFLTKKKNKNEYYVGKSCRFARAKAKQNLTASLSSILNEYEKHFDEISIGSEKSLKTWSRKKICSADIEALKSIFNPFYKDFSQKYGYQILDELNIRTCPYCNRNYTFTIKNTKGSFKTRPEFDHFYDKATYPLLSLSFYNLVPSCPTCNHGKGNKQAGINPYFDGFQSKFKIKKGNFLHCNILAVGDKDGFSLDFSHPSDEERKNIATFGLEELYKEHRDYVVEMIEKANAYNEIQNRNLVEAWQGVNHYPQDVYDFVWGKYLQDADMEKQPLSKLTKDILEQLGIKK